MGSELAKIGIVTLEGMFAFGIIGSVIVVIVAGIEDLSDVFRSDKAELDATD